MLAKFARDFEGRGIMNSTTASTGVFSTWPVVGAAGAVLAASWAASDGPPVSTGVFNTSPVVTAAPAGNVMRPGAKIAAVLNNANFADLKNGFPVLPVGDPMSRFSRFSASEEGH